MWPFSGRGAAFSAGRHRVRFRVGRSPGVGCPSCWTASCSDSCSRSPGRRLSVPLDSTVIGLGPTVLNRALFCPVSRGLPARGTLRKTTGSRDVAQGDRLAGRCARRPARGTLRKATGSRRRCARRPAHADVAQGERLTRTFAQSIGSRGRWPGLTGLSVILRVPAVSRPPHLMLRRRPATADWLGRVYRQPAWLFWVSRLMPEPVSG
jgi:hypothetical protein